MQRRLLLIAIVLIVVSAVSVLWIKNRYGHINPKQVYSEAERTELIMRANAGDAKASWRLYLYYSFVRYDPEQREKWLLVGANAGDERAVYSLAMFYANVDSQRMDLEKASKWADVLENYDAEEAKGVRREIERVREYLKSNM
jgi:hypothetical protein